jgi:hypothetical protein
VVGLLPGSRYWQARAENRICVRLQFVPAGKIDVALWWNRAGGNPDVQLIFGLYDGSVELGMLVGNGFDAPGLHQRGFGTLLVNTAVQALKSVCAPQERVHGLLSNTAEQQLPAERRLVLEANRRAFWRRFGLDVVALGDPPLDYLRGDVDGLRLVQGGMVAGEFPRHVPLSVFSIEPPEGF